MAAEPGVSGDTLTFSAGGGAFLRFRWQEFAYTVFAAVGRGWGEKEGVVVEKSGKRVEALRCTGGVRSILGPDWFAAARIPQDPTGFDLP